MITDSNNQIISNRLLINKGISRKMITILITIVFYLL